MKKLPDNSVDAIITDPPYDLVSINKRFSKEDSAPCKFGTDGSFSRLSKGFMGKKWDGTGIAFKIETWKEAFRVLKPGGHLLSFGGTRTYHRMACAIEDAGFEIRDCIEWVYGSGFPKSLNIGKVVDKLQGNKREILREEKEPLRQGGNVNWDMRSSSSRELTKGTSAWEGWGTALKPAHEPIVLARKPLSEKTVAENVLKWGTGGINIDDSLVEPSQMTKGGCKFKSAFFESGESNFAKDFDTTRGRFPANLIHDGSEEVLREFPSSNNQGHWSKTKTTGFGEFGGGNSEYLGVGEKDKIGGSVARFFKTCEFTEEDYNYPPFFYTAKASKSERNCMQVDNSDKYNGKFPNSKADKDLKNNHPTVKPIKLMEYLIKMITPKEGIVLDPFAGSGTTLVACKKLGYAFIGIEKEEEYIKIIEARLKPYLEQSKL